MSRPYLRHLRLDAFGAFSGRLVGPFGPGLNVVFGPNEAGKTTVASFVGGVLFGWQEARGTVNTYRPPNAERAGSLFFAVPGEDGWREEELSRARNADGLQGDRSLLADLDRETFRTMFSLTSDELRSLRNTSEVTARLLTAGAGTGASPAHALAQLDERIASFWSRAASAERSFPALEARQGQLRERIAAATDEDERLRREDRELRDLEGQRDEMAERIEALNGEIEALCSLRTRVEKLDAEIDEAQRDLEDLREGEAALRAAHRPPPDPEVAALSKLGSAEARAVRGRLDALVAEQAKCEHAVDLAQDNCATSKAAYEALVEAEAFRRDERHRQRQRGVQAALAFALPVVFAAAGVVLLAGLAGDRSLSSTLMGGALILFAVVLASAGLFMLLQPDRRAEAGQSRREDAQWVMLQDQKKLEACRRAREEFRARAREQLAADGMAGADGSVEQARQLLEEAREAREADALFQQRLQATASRAAALEEDLARARSQRAEMFARAGQPQDADAQDVDEAIERRSRRRAGLMDAYQSLSRRHGELGEKLSRAREDRGLDELKLELQQAKTLERESSRDLARLLLARRMLSSAISSWESKSQPEVYRRASRLLALMTEGRWTAVEMTGDGQLQVLDAVKARRDPVHLSLGTCQQLYLALRIALLMEARNVGGAVPILADDILVNFDAERRAGAARALGELASDRQVILFTCHEEVVGALREADGGLTELSL